VDRLAGHLGYCRAGAQARVASHHVHMWEEPPISGWGGSGTIFFSHCTARCLFCQNYPISQIGTGNLVSAEQLASMMLALQAQGCHNINLVTPSHYVPQILAALQVAAERGLHIPLIYNTSGYDAVETLALLDGIVDIYLPDAKYADDDVALQLSGYVDYVEHNRRALLEIVRQVGLEVFLDEEGLAYRGMVVRHLVLPGDLSQTPQVLAWIAEHLGRETTISLMAQYFPAHRAVDHEVLGRHITPEEYQVALDALDALGFDNGWCQELEEGV
jgi:putative pyruvate formate lyase activating enzyme